MSRANNEDARMSATPYKVTINRLSRCSELRQHVLVRLIAGRRRSPISSNLAFMVDMAVGGGDLQ